MSANESNTAASGNDAIVEARTRVREANRLASEARDAFDVARTQVGVNARFQLRAVLEHLLHSLGTYPTDAVLDDALATARAAVSKLDALTAIERAASERLGARDVEVREAYDRLQAATDAAADDQAA